MEAVETGSLAWVRGGAEDVVAAVEDGVLGAGRPAVIVGDAGPLAAGRGYAAPDVVGDGQARRERACGLVRESVGPVLAPTEAFTTSRPVHDYPGTAGTPLSYAEFRRGRRSERVVQSPSAQTVGPVRPDQGAAAAVDGDAATAWRTDPYTNPLEQSSEVDLVSRHRCPLVDVLAVVNPFDGVPVRRVVVSTDDGQSVPAVVQPETGRRIVTLSGGAVSRIRVSVDAVAGEWSKREAWGWRRSPSRGQRRQAGRRPPGGRRRRHGLRVPDGTLASSVHDRRRRPLLQL